MVYGFYSRARNKILKTLKKDVSGGKNQFSFNVAQD